MTTVLAETVSRPYMLNDVVMQAQRLSAALPPDGWDPETERQGLVRQPSGVFDIICFPAPDDEENNDTESAQLIRAATNASSAPPKNVENVGWLSRILRTIRRYLCGHRNEE